MTANETRLVAALDATNTLVLRTLPAVTKDGDTGLHDSLRDRVTENAALIRDVERA